MYKTSYHRASSVDEAAKLMGQAEDGKFVSGGMTLIPTMKQRLAAPSDLIDLRHVAGMKGISLAGKTLRIGAGTTHFEVANSADVKKACPALAHLASLIGDPHVRHMGTIGGSISNNDPAADYPSAMLALGATIITNKRTISADDFFVGIFETALEADEIVTSVEIEATASANYQKFPNPASRYAMTGVFVAKTAGGVRVAVTGAGNDGVFRWAEAENALSSNFSASALDGLSVDADDLMEDMHASGAYRASLIKALAKRAVTAAA